MEQQAGVESAEPEGVSVASVSGPAVRRARAGRRRSTGCSEAAGNAAVTAFLAREARSQGSPAAQPAPDPLLRARLGAPPVMPATSPPRKELRVPHGRHQRTTAFYTAANVFFKTALSNAQFFADKRTLAEVIQTVNAGGVPVLQLFIVSHANEAGNLGFSLDAADLARDKRSGDQKPRTEFKEIKAANEAHSLPAADVKIIDDFTKVEIKGCNIGRSQLMLDEVDKAFGGHAQVIAPTHKQEYSFKGNKKGVASEEALFQYSIEEPGAPPDPSPAELQARFVAKYPAVPADRWKSYMQKVKKDHSKKVAYTHTQPNPPADDAAVVIKLLHASTKWPKEAGWALTYKGRSVISTPKGPAYSYEEVAERARPQAAHRVDLDDCTRATQPDVLKAQEEAKSDVRVPTPGSSRTRSPTAI
jgi:hypothetical protein